MEEFKPNNKQKFILVGFIITSLVYYFYECIMQLTASPVYKDRFDKILNKFEGWIEKYDK